MRFHGIKERFLLAMGLVALTLLLGNGAVYFIGDQVRTNADGMAERGVPLLNATHELKLAVVQVQQWLTDISATRGQDGLDDGFAQARENAQRFHQAIERIDSLAPDLQVRATGIVEDFEAYYQAGRKMAEAYVEGGPAAGNPMMGSFDATAERLAGDVDRLLEGVQARVEALSAEQKTLAANTVWLVLGVSLLALGLLGALYWVTAGALRQVAELRPVLGAIGAGDLSRPVKGRRRDEIGDFARALDGMRVRLAAVVEEIKGGSVMLVDGAARVGQAVSLAGEGAADQRGATDQLSVTVEQMAASANEIATRIAEIAEASGQARTETGSGRENLGGAIARLDQLVGQIEGTSEVIRLLEDQSGAITGILDVIRGIAEQTNLLALNAAIEAARAGEQGRGFAVVADEVRTLASRTQSSTEEIQQMIEKLVAGVNQAVDSMQASAELADSTVREAREAEHSFESIVGLVEHVSQMSAHIASAAEEQSTVAHHIAEHVTAIRDRAETTAGCMQEAAEVVDRMQEQAKGLDDLVGRFNLES